MGLPLDSAAQLFIRNARARGYSARTIEGYNWMFGSLLAYLAERGVETIADVTAHVLANYQVHLVTQGSRSGAPLAMVTQAKLLSMVRTFFHHLTRKGHLLISPAHTLELPRTPKRIPDRVLDLAAMKQLLAAPDVRTLVGLRDRAILELLYSTGLRARELIGLDLHDVDLVEGELTVRHGKGGKSRRVPVGAAACSWTTRYLRESRPHLAKRPAVIALFVTWRGRRFHRVNLAVLVRKHAQRAGLPAGRVTTHGIRHTFATHMLRGKASLRHLQAMLGHEKLETTQIYTKVDISDLKDVHRRCHPRGRG